MQYKLSERLKSLFQKCIRKGRNNGTSLNTKRFKTLLTEEDKKELATYPYPPNILFCLWYKGIEEFDLFKCAVCGKPLTGKQVRMGQKYCGHKCSNSTPEFKEKRHKTNLARYGVIDPCCSKEIEKKRRMTNLKKYGVENPCERDDFNQKRMQTNIEKYGVENPCQNKEIGLKKLATNRRKYYPTFLKNLEKKKLQYLGDYETYLNSETLKFKCLICGTEFESTDIYFKLIHCPRCLIEKKTSFVEEELFNFLKSVILKYNIIRHDRKVLEGREIDFYIPSKNLAIEFNGDYWHSEGRTNKEKDYHQQKSLDCQQKGIRLIHVFEHEWMFKRDKVKNLLKNALGLYDRKIYARKCVVRELDSETYDHFNEENHFDGSVKSSVRIGLFLKDELIACMGFGKGRFDKNTVELYRFTIKNGAQLVGGFPRLIKHAKELLHGVSEIVTYVDYSHFNGRGYENNGFERLGLTPPSYVYSKVSQGKLYSRYQCQKHKLKDILGENFDPELSETENMTNNGFCKVYNSGNLKFKLKL